MIVHILLPSCTHSDHNVFFNILKNVVFRVGRAKLTEHFLDNAFKEGMLARECSIDLNAAAIWNTHSSRRDKISLWTLLGCWASRNCQTFGNVLFGSCWQTTDLVSGTADDIDKFVLPNMKCIVVELNVCESTLLLLKHFVKVPVNEIVLENMVQISPKMKVFDIKNNYWEKCWTFLKRGEWLGIPQEQQIAPSIPFQARNAPKQTLVNSECVTHSYDNYTPTMLARKRTSVVSECNNITPLDLTSKQSHGNVKIANPIHFIETKDIISIEQPQFKLARPNELSMETECNNVTPLNLTSKQSYRIDVQATVNDATTKRIPTTNENLHERMNILQGHLLFALQRELNHKDSQLDERNESLAEAQKSIVVLQLQLIEKNLLSQDLQRQVDEKNNSLAEIEESNRSMQLQLTAKNESVAELHEPLTRIISSLRSELTTKNESLTTIEQSNHNLQLQLTTQIGSSAELHDLIAELKKEKESLTGIELALRVELAAKIELLTEIQGSNNKLQLQLTAKNDSVAELRESVNVLKKEKESLTGIVSSLRSELTAKNESLATIEQSNLNLQLQLTTHVESSAGLQDLIAELKNEKESLIGIESVQRVELAAKNESLTEIQGSNHNLQLQLTAKIKSIAELRESVNVLKNENKSLTGIVSALRLELTAKNESLATIQQSNFNLQLQLTTQIESSAGLQDLIAELKTEKESLIGIESTQRVELEAKNESLTEIQESNHNLQLQLIEKNESTAELRESVNVLQLQLTEKNKSLAELSKLRDVIQETIHSLESEINQKKALMSELEKANHSLQLELFRKNESFTELQDLVVFLKSELNQKHSHEVIPATSDEVTEMVKQASQPEQQSSPGTLQTASEKATEMDEQKSETAIPVEMIEQTLQPEQVLESDDPLVQSCREKLLRLQFGWIKFNQINHFRPGFVHPPDADGITKAQEVTSDGYPSDDKLEFKVFERDIRNAKKKEEEVRKVKLLNKKFNFNFK